MNEARLQPIRNRENDLLIATSEIPTDALLAHLRRYTNLDPYFVLVTPANLEILRTLTDSAFATARAA
jgi:hypothetical protein